MSSPSRLARTAGALYLLLAVFSGLPWWYLNGRIVRAGDPSATAANVAAHASALRLVLLCELAAMVCYVLTAMALYALLRHVDQGSAAAMVVFAAIGAAIMGAVALAQITALSVATDGAYPAALGPRGSDALVVALLRLGASANLGAEVFFGLWLLPMGYLTFRSGYLPRALGVLLVVGGLGYLVDLVETLLLPGVGPTLAPYVLMPAVVAEFWMVGYLLVRARRFGTGRPVSRSSSRPPSPGTAPR